MRLPNSEFTERPWRIHEFAGDFEVEDVWSLPTPGGPDDLGRFARGFTASNTNEISDKATSVLFAIRWRLGQLFGWDDEDKGVTKRVESLRDRLPDDLRHGDRGPDFADVPFRSVYLTDTEWVSELANRTVHGLMHVGWVEDGKGGHHGQLTVLVKPNGALGKAYLVAIKPLRYTVVYPQLIRSIGKNWPQYT
ncbi:hypothetical protein BJF85_24895 [Saccharomonospora sp. CUA-673]|uniref:DUF2867 domain-containing protein n=1 Tax=Saccharomonospora sp. CUA-673 TaxID=1904969 RepID=UPI00095BC67B|nr:DUF2867 domain-containing protein [Saccharomonospora sp. CUA-673]OLT40530.1 hypothetical protein BJF85_24895 [Saccharomonospora sp. CUA-673]